MRNLFYTYYDLLFGKKNYPQEAKNCIRLYHRHSNLPLHSMIEIGCGTGNHTREFAKTIPEITALDIDKQMLALAKNKLVTKNKNVTFKLSRIEQVNDKVPLIVALFNVINYLEDFQKLDMFLKGVSKNLQTGGVFIFDAWNGIAAIRSLPRVKMTKLRMKNIKIHSKLTPIIDLIKQKAVINYEIGEFQGHTCLRKVSFQFLHRLWTPYEITEYAKKYKLHTVKITPVNALNKNAGSDDWKIIYILKKSG